VNVQAAPVLDGVPAFLTELVDVSPQASSSAQDWFERCTKIVQETRTEVLVNFLPSGSDQATTFFARVAAAGGAAYVNCTPTPAVHSPDILKLFQEARLPLLGDDLESQFGSSLLHRTLLGVLEERGLEVVHSYQVNLGGNTDFQNLAHRPEAKKRSKMKAISTTVSSDRVDVIPSGGFVKGLGDNKVGYIVVEGRGWMGTPVTLDLKVKVQDSSNAAGVTIDLVRLARGALDRKIAGDVPLSYYFKNPLSAKLPTTQALEAVRRFDRGESTST
jgi:myo-inositol-1-phosphate synthase